MEKAVCFVVGEVPTKCILRMAPPILIELDGNMDVCQETGTPYFLIPTPIFGSVKPAFELQVKKHKKLGSLPGYIMSPVDSLKGYEVLLRASVPYSKVALEKISQMGGFNVITMEELDTCDNWPLNVQEDFMKRRIGIVSASELEHMAGNFSIDGQVFVKTQFKDYEGHGIVATEEELRAALEKVLCCMINAKETYLYQLLRIL